MPQSTPSSDIARLARTLHEARERFLSSGKIPTEIRPVIAASWRRSLESGIAPDQRSRPVDEVDARQFEEHHRSLLEASFAVVQRLAVGLAGSETAILVAGSDGTVLVAHGDAGVMRAAERLGAVAGARWSELEAGTSGIGTALAVGKAVQVVAGEHYCAGFHSLTCTGAPIHHPFTGQVIGVLSFASDYRQTGALLLPLAMESALAIAAEMRAHLLRDDQILMHSLKEAGDLKAAFAVDLAGNRTLLNRAARFEIAPVDYANLWPLVRRAISTPEACRQEYRLDNHRLVRLDIRPVQVDGEPIGAVVILSPDRERARPGALEEDWTPFPTTAKRPPALLRAARGVARGATPVLIVGEAGVGKSALAAAIHRNSERRGALAIVDCAAELTPARLEASWRVVAVRAAHGTILLERVNELTPEAQSALLSLLDNPPSGAAGERPRVLATATCESAEALRSRHVRSELLDRLATSTILVPPLRDRRDEIPEIALRAFHEISAALLPLGERIQPEAMLALQRYAWPGNVRQLQNVVRGALEARPRQAIHVTALPPEVLDQATLLRRSRIEGIELDAIRTALRESGGNVSSATAQLGLSRSTLYRRLRAARWR